MSDRLALITGGSSGMGLEYALKMPQTTSSLSAKNRIFCRTFWSAMQECFSSRSFLQIFWPKQRLRALYSDCTGRLFIDNKIKSLPSKYLNFPDFPWLWTETSRLSALSPQ